MTDEVQPLNTSGIQPFDMTVLVKPDAPEEHAGASKLILKPISVQETEKYAATKATVIATGENVGKDWGENVARPAIGDRVMIARYAGLNVKGDDGEDYRLCNDEDIKARLA